MKYLYIIIFEMHIHLTEKMADVEKCIFWIRIRIQLAKILQIRILSPGLTPRVPYIIRYAIEKNMI